MKGCVGGDTYNLVRINFVAAVPTVDEIVSTRLTFELKVLLVEVKDNLLFAAFARDHGAAL